MIFPRSEATLFVRVSNAVSSPPAQTARYLRNASVTPTVQQETLVLFFQRSQQLLPGSNAVSVYFTCVDCRHHAKWQQRIAESFMIDDEDKDHVPHKDVPESRDDEFARSIRVRDAAPSCFHHRSEASQ